MRSIVRGRSKTFVVMPASDECITDDARLVAAHALPLLAKSNAQLLSLTIRTRELARPIAMCWTGTTEPISLPSVLALDQTDIRRALYIFEQAGERLLASLVRRWPANAAPPAIGIVTDGSGVVFSSDHPSPLYPNWLALHQGGMCTPTTLLAFSRNGAWASLSERVETHRLH